MHSFSLRPRINIKDTGNAHFGITRKGDYIFGYLNQKDIESLEPRELVTGVIWLVRNGENFVKEAGEIEGTQEEFMTMKSARVAIAHDKEGNLFALVVDGSSRQRGINLFDFADVLVELGAVNVSTN